MYGNLTLKKKKIEVIYDVLFYVYGCIFYLWV